MNFSPVNSDELNRRLRDWVVGEGSPPSVVYRAEALSAAFGLAEDFVVSYLFRPYGEFSGIGYYLRLDMLWWTEQYPDLSANNSEYLTTDWTDIDLG